jgi:tetratricopeptide (TPR) repeat protein
MRRALQALALSLAVTGVAAPASAAHAKDKAKDAPAAPQLDYVAVSRALTEIDSADRRGELGDELAWTQAAEANPDDLVAQFLSFAAQPEQEGRWQGYHQLSLDHPQSALPWVGMARVYLAWRTWDQAEKAIATALQRDPRCWLAVRLRAELAEARKQPEKAQADYQEVLKSDPKDPEAHFGLARLAKARGDAEEAHAQAAAALEEAQSLPGAWAILGQLAEDVGEPAAAIDFWKGAVQQAPGDREARAALARLLAAQGDHAGALEQWEAIVQLKETPEALAALAAEAHAANKIEAEQGAVERLAKLHPSPEQWKRVAALRMGAGDTEGAERAYRRVLDGSPRDPEANLGVGRILLTRGDAVRAVEALRASGEPGKADLGAVEKRLELEKLARPDVVTLQRAVQAKVDKVYRARLAATPTLSGTLRVRVTVDGAGTATVVEVLEDSVHDGDVRACAYWNLRDATYPQQKPGRYSFAFSFKK